MKFRILYVAGFTRSGSTLTDILLGNQEKFFSSGELCFLGRNGFLGDEFCSCLERVKNCSFWSKVFDEWSINRILPLEKYDDIYFKTFGNKYLLRMFFIMLFPSKTFKLFVRDTIYLYRTIAKISGCSTIVDSSKSPFRILLLRYAGLEIDILHIVRGIRGVLFSSSKHLIKNPLEGVEIEIKPRSNWFVIFKWIWINFLCIIFSAGKKRKVLKFENLIHSPALTMDQLGFSDNTFLELCKNRGPFFAEHLVAGGRVRMREEIYIEDTIALREKWYGTGFKEFVVSSLGLFTPWNR